MAPGTVKPSGEPVKELELECPKKTSEGLKILWQIHTNQEKLINPKNRHNSKRRLFDTSLVLPRRENSTQIYFKFFMFKQFA